MPESNGAVKEQRKKYPPKAGGNRHKELLGGEYQPKVVYIAQPTKVFVVPRPEGPRYVQAAMKRHATNADINVYLICTMSAASTLKSQTVRLCPRGFHMETADHILLMNGLLHHEPDERFGTKGGAKEIFQRSFFDDYVHLIEKARDPKAGYRTTEGHNTRYTNYPAEGQGRYDQTQTATNYYSTQQTTTRYTAQQPTSATTNNNYNSYDFYISDPRTGAWIPRTDNPYYVYDYYLGQWQSRN
ncbi:hypothetical protein DdX_21100 [Ditylenchus destructor]|uniref:Uncharacterized protein n=1 Tax=Ditylenchus destructor TaxID=166010 RepID=A0AAD4QVU7_9BILA|nr:hypothetical protein DdX_21100 [Ditylenchus destructor]